MVTEGMKLETLSIQKNLPNVLGFSFIMLWDFSLFI